MTVDRRLLALKKQKSHSMIFRLLLSAISGLFTYGILLSAYVNDLTQLALIASSFGILMVAVAMKTKSTHISKDK